MSLSDAQIEGIARLTFGEPYTMKQLASLIHASYREVYDFFRTKRAKELFIICRPWVEVLEEADPKLSQGKRTFYKKWVQNPDILVRLSPKGFDLITAGANLKLRICSGSEPKNRQQKRQLALKAEKQIFRKLNYPQLVLDALEAGELEPSDLPTSGKPGSAKYLALVPNRKDRILQEELFQKDSEFLDSGQDIEEFSPLNFQDPDEPKKSLPAGWTLDSMMENYTETHTPAFGAFGAEGIPEEGEPTDLPYSHDRMLELFDQAMYKKFEPFKLGKCGPERFKVVNKLIKANIKNFGYTIDIKDEKGKRKFIPNNQELFDECVEDFQDYLERTTNERLVLMPKKDIFGDPLFKPNANRFNNEEKRIEARLRFENIFGDASRKYKSAILLTLTSGQWHRNIFEDTKKFQENFNKLITRLRKEAKDQRINDLVKRNPEFLRVKISKNLNNMPGGKEMAGYEFSSDILTPHAEKSLTSFLEATESFQVRTRTARRHEGLQGRNESDAEYFRRIRRTQKTQNIKTSEFRKAATEYVKSDNNLKLPYLCVREFQRNGNVHYHIVIFGIRWLKRNDEISKIWQEYGQGKITKINKISWNDTQGYIWAPGQAPEDAKGRQPLEYLKKYLLKGQYAEKNPEAALLYWVFNSRFFTYSSSLLSDEHRPRPYISKGLYEFAGVIGLESGFELGDARITIYSDSPLLGSAEAICGS
ncbi:hypothetical protein [Methanosarcina barkeri]|uniref:Replication-associated protein ORF2/G2P domain-containing protein n=1 Tax=Methanosarcina barkeri (strain Fusaro / DSM 804) TaxID=269797 RepID=Q46AC8_METBF|nr:hypothetical protein [Methanosarcina barkeri]